MHVPLVVLNKKWRFRLQRTFFGLNDKYIEGVYEEFFLMKYHGGWSFIEAYNLPILIRRWFLQRLIRQFEIENEQQKKNSQKKSYGPGGRI